MRLAPRKRLAIRARQHPSPGICKPDKSETVQEEERTLLGVTEAGCNAQGRTQETLAGHRRLRAERSTSAVCSIWRRTGSSMGARCSSEFAVSPRLRI